jgi:hypothetical protein
VKEVRRDPRSVESLDSRPHCTRTPRFDTAILVVFAVLGFPLGGCAYLTDRGKDFGDILSFGVSTGGGFVVRVVPTRVLSVEFGVQSDETFYGLRRRHLTWMESSYGFPWANFWGARIGEEDRAPWVWTDSLRTSNAKLVLLDDAHPRWLPGLIYEESTYHLFVLTGYSKGRVIDLFDIECDVGFLFFGLQFVVNPAELLDFFGGIVGFDLAGDDTRGLEPPREDRGGGDGTSSRSVDAATNPEETPRESSATVPPVR